MLSAIAFMATAPQVAIVPQPVSIEPGAGAFRITARTRIVADAGTENVTRMLRAYLSPATGYPLPAGSVSDGSTIQLILSPGGSDGAEGYRLRVTPTAVIIQAARPAGLFYGVQTLRQLLPAAIYRPNRQSADWTVPAVNITDKPRFAWRGLMLDVCRHFMPKEDVKRYLDAMAANKLNSFHWHLTDDQGWRIEIKKYPKLTQIGSVRKETMAGHYRDQKFDGTPHGGFYTQADIREIVKYAADRYINVVPEIEMPGHATAAIAAYPELGNTGKPVEVATKWGVFPSIFNAEDSTLKFLQDVLDEVIGLFPSQFIHTGGDEAPKAEWKASEAAQAKIKALGLSDEDELQSWFIHQMDAYLAKRGRRLIGWDEILEGGLAPGATVMSWRGIQGGIAAAKSGHDVVMSPTDFCYFDYYQARPTEKEPIAIGGYVPLSKVYDYEPIPLELSGADSVHVLGAQGNLWTEYIPDMRQAMYMAYPRAAALAEVVWSLRKARNYDDFMERLPSHLARLEGMGVTFRPLTGNAEPAARWSPDILTSEFAVREWDVTPAVGQAGDFNVRFQYASGAHRLDIEWAELVVDGRVVGRDAHAGRTGAEDQGNEYRFPATPKGARVILRAFVRADGGTDSRGEIFVNRRG